MNYYPEFARLLNQELERADQTASWLARRLGVSPTTVTRWLNHGTRPATPETIVKIADVLGINTQRQALLVATGYGYQAGSANDESLNQTNLLDPLSADDTALDLADTSTPFVGRKKEISDLLGRIHDSSCRLLTLVGPGGIGKTRLAIEVAKAQQLPAVYVPLQALASPEMIPSTIADAVGIQLSGADPLTTQLLQRLKKRRLLLVLDNFEHLLGGAELVGEILRQAPAIKLLITSREALQLHEEWLYLVHGLPVPSPDEHGDPYADAAVQLFHMRAVQTRHDFSLEAQLENVITICRAVEGMPLAIELAAGWLTVLPCTEIAGRLRQNLDFLSTSLRDVPQRHQSMRAVFDGSWQMLDDAQRDTLMQLSVFQGGFSLEAAAAVARTTLAILSDLVTKSLIVQDSRGRYQMHELLRQYASEKLAALPERQESSLAAHSAYFIRFLADRGSYLTGPRQIQVAHEVTDDLDNALAAWQWAIERLMIESIRAAGRTLHNIFQLKGRYLQGANLFARASQRLDTDRMTIDRGIVLIETLTDWAFLCIRLGRLDDADAAVCRARRIGDELRILHHPDVAGYPLSAQMFLALTRGDYELATQLGSRFLQIAEKHPQSTSSIIHYGMASAALAQDDYVRAKRHATQGLTIASSWGNQRSKTFLHGILGQTALAEGQLRIAQQHFEVARLICEELMDPGETAEHLANLGEVALRRQEWNEAQAYFQRSLAMHEQTGNRGGRARAQLGLGIGAQHVGESNIARGHYRLAVEIANETQVIPLILSVLAGIGEFLLQEEGTNEVALRTTAFVLCHPACEALARQRALDSLAHANVAVDTLAHDSSSLEELVAILHATLV